MSDCNRCLWATRNGSCASWDCKFVDQREAYEAYNREKADANKWIPCSERLPELYKPVLVTGGDIIWICELIESPDLDDGEFQWEDKMIGHWYSFDNWDAWQPLPEPYKEGKDETN